MDKDFYKILGVSESASQEEIKKAYRTLAHKYHPDKSSGDEAKFKEINEAYQTLSDVQKKQHYDTMRKFGGAYQPGQGFSGFGGFSPFGFSGSSFTWDSLDDLLGEFFGGMSGFGYATKQRTRTQPKQVITMTIQGPKGVNMVIEISGAKSLPDKARKMVEEFARNLFKELD